MALSDRRGERCLRAGKVVVPIEEKLKGQKFRFLLGSDGALHQLEGSVESPKAKVLKLDVGCGETVDSAVLELKDAAQVHGQFILSSPVAKPPVKWFPARRTNGLLPKACESLYPKQKVDRKYVIYETGTRPARVFELGWSTFGSIPQNCDVKDGIAMVGIISDSNESCLVLNKFDWQCLYKLGGHVKATNDFLGILNINDKETWLLYTARQYESSGFSAILLEGGDRADKEKMVEVLNEGC